MKIVTMSIKPTNIAFKMVSASEAILVVIGNIGNRALQEVLRQLR